jgi:hypothetical protein
MTQVNRDKTVILAQLKTALTLETFLRSHVSAKISSVFNNRYFRQRSCCPQEHDESLQE